ncbi:MAG: VanZ family protein [Anaerolineae bacterium]
MRRFLWRWLPPLIWMGTIFAVSAHPTLPSVPGFWDLLVKKVLHAAAYGVLMGLILRALRGYWSDAALIRLASSGLSLAYALSDEYHQTLVPGRNGNLLDVAVDAVGIAAVMVIDWRRQT